MLGVTSARVRQVLKDLVVAGAIRVRTSAAGTMITLLEGGRAYGSVWLIDQAVRAEDDKLI